MTKSGFVVGDFEIKSIKEDDPEFFMLEGYASVYGNVDSYRDICEKGCFDQDLIENGNERPILWQHNQTQPIGIGVFSDSEMGLKVCVKMPKASKFVSSEVMPMIRCKAVKGLSIGYFTIEEQYDREERVNRLQKLLLRETSVVTFPANNLALITAAKQTLGIDIETKDTDFGFSDYSLLDIKSEWNEKEAIDNIKKNTGSIEEPSKNYGKGFLVKGSEGFDSYRYPYVKYDGKGFKIVPKAIYSLAAKMMGGSLNDLTASQEVLAKQGINKIYKKLGQEEPFKSGDICYIDVSTLKAMSKQDFVTILGSEQILFSTSTKEFIANALLSPEPEGSVTEGSKSNELERVLAELKSLV